MDPVTAALNLVSEILRTYRDTLAAMPEEQRAEFAKMQFEDLKFWRKMVEDVLGVAKKLGAPPS